MADIHSKSPVVGQGPAGRPPSPPALIIAGIAALILVLFVLFGRADEPQVPETQVPETQVPEPQVPDQTTPPATSVAPETAVWPWETSSTRFAEPVDAARSFATDFLGFTNPVIGPFMQGDSRSGEVEVRPLSSGPVTTVLVRQGGDDTWWVIGAATEQITLEEPDVLDEIRSPVRVQGSALAFEGTVQVHIREDGRREPIGRGFVTGGGQKAESFEGMIDFSTPTAPAGAIVLFTESADDGRVWQAAVVRVQLSGTHTHR